MSNCCNVSALIVSSLRRTSVAPDDGAQAKTSFPPFRCFDYFLKRSGFARASLPLEDNHLIAIEEDGADRLPLFRR